MTLAQQINQAKELSSWLHGKTNEKTFVVGNSDRAGFCILQHAEDVADAIIVLLEAKLPGPAISLARPLFEAYVRGFWLLNCASEQQVIAFMGGSCPNFSGLLAAIPNDAESGGAWIHATSRLNLVAFHDLTHGGAEHVIRRCRDDSIEPTYPEQEQESLLRFSNEVRIGIAAVLLSRLNDEKGIEELHERAKILRKEP